MELKRAIEQRFFRVATAVAERITAYENAQAVQRLLYLQYRGGHERENDLSFQESGFRCFSQCDEDGLLLYLAARAGIAGGKAVELGFSYPIGSNITNLIVNHGWQGLGIEGDSNAVNRSELWFSRHRSTMFNPPKIIQAWLAQDSASGILVSNGFGDVDVLSIDVDGIDYWIWEKLECRPKIVVVEFNPLWEAGTALTVPASEAFTSGARRVPGYFGASLQAMADLGRRKGYSLVGTNALGFNAFFIVDELQARLLLDTPSIDAELEKPLARRQREMFLPSASHLPWVSV